jgi:hypothetical protein
VSRRLAVGVLAALVALPSPVLAQGAPAAPPAATPPPAASPSTTAAPPPAPAAPADGASAPTPEDQRKEAEAAFRRGLELLKEDAWQAALAEFLRSRELFPTRNATNNAAYCLRRLKRFDESLDMYEAMLREYPDLDAEKKEAAQKEIAELRGLVGTIDVVGAEPGASIVVDGRPRPDYPLIDPLRVSAGTHTIRLFKGGFRPFETRVDVAGGQTVRVDARMPALAASGRIRVAEKSGAAMDVVIGGAVVGVTPWEGSVPVGDQVLWLAGDADRGTQPVRVPVQQGETTNLTLAAELLEAAITVEVKPAAASIRVDGVDVGRGVFEGRLRRGRHVIEVLAAGYFPQKRTVDLERGDVETLVVALERDEDAEAWSRPSRVTIDLTGGFAVGPSLGGDVGASPALGGLAQLRVSYELGSGLLFGLGGGFLQVGGSSDGREATLAPVGLDEPLAGTADDDVRLRGAMVGVHGGYRFFEDVPVRLQLGAGAVIGSARDERTGTYASRAGTVSDAPALASEATAAFVYVAPEATVGLRLGDHVEVGAGLQVLALIAASSPAWGDDDEVPAFVVPGDGLVRHPADETTAGTTVLFVPGLHARALF